MAGVWEGRRSLTIVGIVLGVPVGSACGPPRFVDSLAGLRPILALIWPVFGENPANAGVGGHRGGRCWLQLTEAGHLAGVWQA